MTKRIEVRKADSQKHGFHAYVDGVMLRSIAGIGRRFKTEKAARKAAEKVVAETGDAPYSPSLVA